MHTFCTCLPCIPWSNPICFPVLLQVQKAKKISDAQELVNQASGDKKVQKAIGKPKGPKGRGRGRGKKTPTQGHAAASESVPTNIDGTKTIDNGEETPKVPTNTEGTKTIDNGKETGAPKGDADASNDAMKKRWDLIATCLKFSLGFVSTNLRYQPFLTNHFNSNLICIKY